MSIRNLRLPCVLDKRGCGRTKLYNDIQVGTFSPPVKDGPMSVWPEHEVDAINAAIVAGYTDDQKRELVRELVKARTTAPVFPSAA